MKRVLAPLALPFIALAACARPVSSPSAAPPNPILATDANGGNVRGLNNAGPLTAELSTTPTVAHRALVSVYDELGLAPQTIDETSYRVARTNLIVRRLLGGQRASVYFDCGQSLTGARADEGRLTVNVASQATPTATGTVVATEATAIVRSNEGTSNAAIGCNSTGRLENQIHEMVKRRG